MRRRSDHGFTLIEMLIYASLLAMIGVVLTTFASQVIQRNAHTQLKAQVLNNARGVMGTITQEIRHASGVYDPTSVFGSHPGQLSLSTTQNLPADETETYVDFYIDDDRLYRKRESEAAQLITGENVSVTNLTFSYINQTAQAPAIKVNLTITPKDASSVAAAQSVVTLTSTASLRSY